MATQQEQEPFDQGYDACEERVDRDKNPYDEAEQNEERQEWDEGWERCEVDDETRSATYCGGGVEYDSQEFDMEVIIDRRRCKATVSYEYHDESEFYYRAEDPTVENVRGTTTLTDADGEDYENEFELEELSLRQQRLVIKACYKNAEG